MFNVQNIVGTSRSFEHWHHATCHNYSKTDYRRASPGPFLGNITARSLGTLTVSMLSSVATDGRIQVLRNAAEIRRDPRDHFMLLLVYRGDVGFEQSGRTVRLGHGEMLIYDQARPFTIELGGENDQIIVSIPRPLLASRLPETERFTARPIPASSQLGTLTGSMIRQLIAFDHELDSEIASRVASSALDLLTATLQAELADPDAQAGCHDPRLARVKRFVAARLEDCDMTIESISAAQNLAPRTLHRLFAAEGTTPIRWLWQQRLSASYKALAEGRIRNVTDAALSFGFTDLSHFSRAFKKAFGHPPQALVRRG
ncbi:helix-turn-helix domain-containing protein [Bradyrhizobium sp. HKCCYLS2038]|uniref:AraC-like ligand-binding domain-containing protein n=1 Tax=unclassified Bradyrhizobium TaxID=2631580 RepID=UPI003EB80D1F